MSYNNCQGEVLLLGKKEHATELTKIEIFFSHVGGIASYASCSMCVGVPLTWKHS